MWQNQTYLSVVKPPASDGNLVLNLESFNAVPNVVLDITVALSASDNEVQTARKIQDGINAALTTNSVQYSGTVVFSSELPPATWRLTRTEHCICMWGQAQYAVTISNNQIGVKVNIGPSPTFATLADASNLVPQVGADYTGIDGEDLPDDQLALLLEVSSDQLVKLLNNRIVTSTYFHEESGRRTGSIFYKNKPVVSFDIPQVRRPYIIGITTTLISKSAVAYNLNRRTGELNYRFTNDIIDLAEPFDINNEIKGTYIAGYMAIPAIIKQTACKIAIDILEDPSIRSMKAGTGAVEYRPPLESLNYMLTILRQYLQ